jgi:sugar lactone lactonase YvrE
MHCTCVLGVPKRRAWRGARYHGREEIHPLRSIQSADRISQLLSGGLLLVGEERAQQLVSYADFALAGPEVHRPLADPMGHFCRRVSLHVQLRKVASAFFLVVAGVAAPLVTFAQTASSAYAFSHLAGPLGGPGTVDGTGAAARFYRPWGVATDNAGNIYVADTTNYSIRKITPGGVVTTYAGKSGSSGTADGAATDARFSGAWGVAADKSGNVYVADTSNNSIRKISPQGIVTTLAGLSDYASGGSADGTGVAARFYYPTDVAVDSAGNVYVADLGNYTIRKITPAGVVTTLAGVVGVPGSQDSPVSAVNGLSANFASPVAVAVDGAGYVYVADADNNTIRKITPAGLVSTLAGTAGIKGSVDGTGVAARFDQPVGIVVDAAGVLYVSDQNNCTIRKITPTGVVTTFAGSAGQPGVADGSGSAAQFGYPAGLAMDATGNIYGADSGSCTVRKVTPAGVVSTLAGNPYQSGITDGTGTAARFEFPAGITTDAAGNAYVADILAGQIRKVSQAGVVTTLAGGNIFGLDPETDQWYFLQVVGIAVDTTGNAYITDAMRNTIRKITPTGTNTVIAGMSGVAGSADGGGTSAQFNVPTGLVIDGSGNLFVTDFSNCTIRKITPAGLVSTLAGQPMVSGSADGIGAAASFGNLGSLSIDTSGNLFATDITYRTVRRITPTGTVTTIAKLGGSSEDAIGGIALDASGNIYVAVGSTIEKITSAGVVSAIGGALGSYGSADGVGAAANFTFSGGLAIDGSGALYIADSYNAAIRKGVLAGPPVISTQPQSQTVSAGNSVQFSVVVSSVTSYTCQWYLNNGAIAGATGISYSIASASSGNAGDYTVVVNNGVGSVTSNKATLTISGASSPASNSGGGGGGGLIEPTWCAALGALVLLRRFLARK